ncbi:MULTISPECIES: hypothetical protein [Methylobacterium]|nr:hypothetical protein [Methylobacterium sp. DB0501]
MADGRLRGSASAWSFPASAPGIRARKREIRYDGRRDRDPSPHRHLQ